MEKLVEILVTTPVISNPLVWLILFSLSSYGVEQLPCIKRFREAQFKLPRFTKIPGHRWATFVLAISFPWIFLGSAVMLFITVTHWGLSVFGK